jgi:colanic acid biosynthesis glycosyl transferase WcaI
MGINYWPDQTGIAPFTTGRCEYLAARGHRVTVYTGFPYYPSWRVPSEYRGRLLSREVRNGVSIFRSWLYVPRHVTGTRRILHEASFIASASIRTLARVRREKPDLLFVVSPPLGLGLTALTLSRLWKVPYIIHVADLQPDAALELGMLAPSRTLSALFAIERLAYRSAARVSTLTHAIRRRIVQKGVTPEKVVLFSDWADPALFNIPLDDCGDEFKRSFGLCGRFLVLHAGNVGVKQGLEVMLNAAELSRGNDIAWLVAGDGAMRETLQERARERGLDNLWFIPLQPDRIFREMLAAADVCLVTQRKTVGDVVFPSKVLTLLAAGRPVIASLNMSSAVARAIQEAEAGLLAKPEDPSALLTSVLALQSNAEARAAMRSHGRSYARQHWDRESILPFFEAELARVAEPRRVATAVRYSSQSISA